MQKGSIPLINPINHNFRDREKNKEMDKTGGIIVKTQEIPKKRAETAQMDFRSGHLKNDLYDPNLPHKSSEHWLRVNDQTKEKQPFKFGVNEQNENQRLQKEILEKEESLDYQAKDMKMVHFPDWKEPQKNKWMDTKTFDLYVCTYQGFKSKEPWEQFPINENNQNNQYIEGFEVIGDLSRKKIKEKQGDRFDFQPTIRNDPMGTAMHISTSIRTLKQDQVLNVQEQFDKFSTNNKLQHYKTALVKTKSVDRMVPFNHSNNFQSMAFKNLRPQKQEKLYLKSIPHQGQTLIMKKPPKPQVNNTQEKDPQILLKDQQQSNVIFFTNNYTQSPSIIRQSSLAKIQEYPVSQNNYTLSNIDNKTPTENQRRNTGQKSQFKNSDEFDISNLGYPYKQMDDNQTRSIIDKYFRA